MPIYEYRCKKCLQQFDFFQKMGADGGDLNCPHCGEPRPKKVFSVFSSSGSDSTFSGPSCASGAGFT